MGIFSKPKIKKVPKPPSTPTFADAGRQAAASRSGFTGASVNPSLISSGGASGLTKRANTKSKNLRSLIGGA